MRLKEKQGIIIFFFYESLKKERRKPQETQRNKNVCVKPHLKNKVDSNACNNLLHMHFLRLKSVKSLKIIHFFKLFLYKLDFYP